MKHLTANLFLSLGMAFVLLACDKEENIILSPEDRHAAEIENELEAIFQDIGDISYSAMQTETNEMNGRSKAEGYEWKSECATLLFEEDSRLITIDFGTGSCADGQGNLRSGKIIISFNEKGWTTSLENFTFEGKTVEGIRQVTYEPGDDWDFMRFRITVEDGKVSWPDGSFTTREVNTIHTWDFQDRGWYITGTASGVSDSGQHYESEITTPLFYSSSCLKEGIKVPVKGETLIRRSQPEEEDIVVDFGDGDCDRILSVKTGETVETIEL